MPVLDSQHLSDISLTQQ